MIKIIAKKNIKTSALGLGIFDGMHLGHQEIAKQASALLTMFPHPDVQLGKNKKLKMLSTLKELKAYHKKVLVLRFSKRTANLKPRDFLDEIKRQLKPEKIVVGYDFHFGKNNSGNVELLKEWAQSNAIKVVIVDPVEQQQVVVKSKTIRTLMEEHRFNEAIGLLGHAYLLIGKVVRGDGRGSTIGFPTANLMVPKNKLVPSPGVYKGQVKINNKFITCLIYIGKKPTFGAKKQSIEVHIPGIKISLYHKLLSVFLELKVRDEIAFASVEELVSQIEVDLKRCGVIRTKN
jgi:riboflavin kinase/FMN adenylyltransferase